MTYGVLGAFKEFRETVDADVKIVTLARQRRDKFKSAMNKESDVSTVWGSGSLARSTQLQPVHDVDLVVEFKQSEHPSWGQAGSAAEALERAASIVRDRLGPNGTDDQIVRQVNTAERNRSAKCFLDDPDDPDGFTVDVMPALRQDDGRILIPSVRNDTWDVADPQHLIRLVADRSQEWASFRPLVRVLKKWGKSVATDPKVKSLVMEILALDHLQVEPSSPAALKGFFAAAAVADLDVKDPAGLCGPIQPDLDVSDLRDALEDAAQQSESAERLRVDGDEEGAGRLWRQILGPDFPAPPEGGGGSGGAGGAGGGAAVAGRPVKDSPQGSRL